MEKVYRVRFEGAYDVANFRKLFTSPEKAGIELEKVGFEHRWDEYYYVRGDGIKDGHMLSDLTRDLSVEFSQVEAYVEAIELV